MGDKILSIIVLNWNRLRYSRQTIENLIKKTTVPHELILVDNNSSEPGLKEYLLGVSGNKNTIRVERVFNSKNLGVGGGRNSGLVKAKGDYLMTIDDDILVPENYDIQLIDVCDKVPKLGITGINVEPTKYPASNISGVKFCPKNGNLGGGCLCMPRRIHNTVGFYNCFSLYGHEDCSMFYRLTKIGLISAYIAPRGIHLDKDEDKEYRKAKNNAHERGSIQLGKLSSYLKEMRTTGNVYVPYDPNYSPVDENIFTNELILQGKK